MNSVLFICTGNYYRSRMAEELFNFWAKAADLPWEAHSAGLRRDMSKSPNEGPISKYAVQMLSDEGFPIASLQRYPESVSRQQLEIHDVVICLHRPEHEPMLQKRFPDHDSEVLFWDVPDVQVMEPPKAYNRIKKEVEQLVSLLRSGAI